MIDEEILIDENTKVEECVTNLCDAINQCPEYLRYKKALEEIKKNEDLYNQVNNLRKTNFNAHNSSNGRMSYDEYQNLYNATRIMRQNPVVNEFLDAELDLARMMQNLHSEISRAVEFDSDFL